ncbi:MAG: outer membrane-specific lipoprotein transporter subunit LolC [Chloroflexi bacterium ADurb.Bin325]|nr:MAG: outer membrane-specific lipoprotein transporter subunit LolC [Chloroflexi bacterium ADurb.Bin325]
MKRTLYAIGWRYLARRPWQSGLMLLGIALGVSVMVAIDLANAAAARAFDLSTDAIAGRATHQIVGGPEGVDEAVYAQLRAATRMPLAPVVADYVASPELGDRPLQLLGVDPFAEAPFRSYLVTPPAQAAALGDPADVGQLVAFLTQPGALLLSEGLARDYSLALGDAVRLEAAGRESRGFVAGLLRPADGLARRALDGMALADIATAQEALGRIGRLSHIDAILPDDAAAAALADRLPPGVQLVRVSARSGAVEQMASAFRTNLTALSLLALVVGMFLIYNSMTFSVVQRRPLFGTLRCLGVTRGEVGRLVLGEALIVGVLGSLAGLGLGVLLGQAAVRLVTQTINDLYFVVTVRGLAIDAGSLLKGFLLGVAATVVSSALPAWEAAAVSPRLALTRSGLEDRARRALPAVTAAGLTGILAGAGLLAIPTRDLVVSFAGIFLLTIGFALLAPAFTWLAMRAAAPVGSRLAGVLGRMAPRSIAGALSRTAVAIAALMVAVSVTIGVGLMVDSFRSTVVAWLGQTLWGDVYISVPQINATRSAAALDPRVVETAGRWPGVAHWEVLRSVDVASPDGAILVSAVSDDDLTAPRLFVSTDGSRAEVAAAVRAGAVLASEPLANRLGLPPRGATVTLYTDHGPQAFPVAGVYRDYSSSQGAVMMTLGLYRQHWDDPTVTAALLVLEPAADVDAVTAGLRDALRGIQGVAVQPNAALRAEALAVFDRAFAITGALQMLAAIVAFIGVLSALLSLQLERTHEFGVLRAVGLTVRQFRGLVLMETGLMGAVAGLLAMPTGFALAVVLIFIINRRSFGWTMQLRADPLVFGQALALAVGAALLAGVYPALRMGRMAAAEALRGE